MHHIKIDGKFVCQWGCGKEYSHTRHLKNHYSKEHILEIEDLPPQEIMGLNLHRKSRVGQQRGKGDQEEEKKGLTQEYETPVYVETLKIVVELAKKFPVLGNFN